jgi:hypothetical protein
MDKAKIEALQSFFFFISGYAKATFVSALALKLGIEGLSASTLLLVLGGSAYVAGRFDSHLWALGKLK